jgi:hypothetical protein
VGKTVAVSDVLKEKCNNISVFCLVGKAGMRLHSKKQIAFFFCRGDGTLKFRFLNNSDGVFEVVSVGSHRHRHKSGYHTSLFIGRLE